MVEMGPEKMETWAASNGVSEDLNHRFSTAIMNFNAELSGCRTGALVQVWMGELLRDGTMVLQTKGLPFSISGVGDLLALFRCVSCRYRFTTDTSKPQLMGVIGRVYSSGQPELCYDVQLYDKSVYLRASEARRCSVHSTIVTPVYLTPAREMPAAVVEVSHHDKDVKFAEIVGRLSACLENVQLYMADIDINCVKIGLRNWPVDMSSLGDTAIKDDGDALFRSSKGDHAQRPVWRGTEGIKSEAVESPAGGAVHVPVSGTHPCVSSVPAIRVPSKGEYVSRSASGPLFLGNIPSRRRCVSRNMSGPLTRPSLLSGSEDPLQCSPALAWPSGPDGAQVSDYTCLVAKDSTPGSAHLSSSTVPAIMECGTQTPVNGEDPACTSLALPSLDAPAQPEFLSSSSEMSDLSDAEDTETSRAKDKKKDRETKGRSTGGTQLERSGSGGQSTKNDNRLGGGAGKRLTFKELQVCFGVGLKEAAAQLGICPTTLKRACRRNGISRWPSRQISKLSKAWHQMGYQGSPPSWLVHKAITGNLKCDNLAFSLNAGLHLGLMQAGAAQPVSCAQRPVGWNALAMEPPTVAAPAVAPVLPRDTTSLNMAMPSSGPADLPPLPTDQADFLDEMAGILHDSTVPLGWNCSGTGTGALHALNPAHEAPRVFRDSSSFSAQGFLGGSPEASSLLDNRQGQGREPAVTPLAAFDGLGDNFAGDPSFASVLNRPGMDGISLSGMDVSPSVSEIGITSGLF